MGITIDEAKRRLLEVKACLHSLTEENQKDHEAFDMAISTMRKYQKIVQIMERTVDDGTSMYDTLQEIEEVIEDGNVD